MNMDKNTFMGIIQAASSLLLLAGLDQFDNPEIRDAMWMVWLAVVGIAAALKGWWSKAADDKVMPLSQLDEAEIGVLHAQRDKIIAEKDKIKGG